MTKASMTKATAPAPDFEQRVERLLLSKEIEEFIYTEAELLDNRKFEAWLDLFTDDVRYWMPMHRNVRFDNLEREETREREEFNWFDEGKSTLALRVQQVQTGVHWAEEPLSRVCHMFTNIQIVDANSDEVAAKCRFLIYRNRMQEETDFFVGKREDTFRRVDGQWKIAHRKIVLDQNVLLAKNLSVFF